MQVSVVNLLKYIYVMVQLAALILLLHYNADFVTMLSFSLFSSMHNISVSGDLPNARRRCASEGKRPKSRPRPVSAFINPIGHGRTGTEPNLSVLPHNSFPSSSTTDLLSTESPKKEKSPLMNRLMPKHKFNSGKCKILCKINF